MKSVGQGEQHTGGFWVGPAPRTWAPVRVKHLARIYAGGTPDRENRDYWDDGTIPWLNSGAVNQWLVVEPSEYITEEGFRNSSAKWIPKGALVLALAGQGKTKGMVAELAIDSTCNQSMAAVVPSKRVYPRFLLYWLHANYEPLRNRAGGEQRDGLNLEIVGEFPCFLPAVGQQRAIANYLDRETARIDALVAAKERLLVLLAEKRRALITRAVTRGLDPSIPLRDSGIPWLGNIPAHWALKRGKWLFRERDERSVHGDEILLSLRMERGLVPHNEVSEKETRPEELVGYKRTSPGELVVNRMRAAVGLIATTPQEGLVSPDYAVFVPAPGISVEYYGHLFTTELLGCVFRSVSTGLGTGSQGFLRLYSDSFLALWFPAPPPKEQRLIVSHLERVSTRLDALSSGTARTITLLKERRAALIAAAVTGQLDVEAAA